MFDETDTINSCVNSVGVDTICNIGDKKKKAVMDNITKIAYSKGVDLDVNSSNMFDATDTINYCVNRVNFNCKVKCIAVHNNSFNHSSGSSYGNEAS